MQRFTNGASLPPLSCGGVVALGNFDGFHSGHRAVVGAALAQARAQGRPALVASFDPHPARLFRPDTPAFALSTMAQRGDWLADFGMDGLVVMPFDAGLAALSPADFVAQWLVERLGVAGVVTGDDFTFGKGRAGTVADLAAMGAANGFSATVVSPVQDADGTISSTRIRALLRAGDMAGAAALLGRPFTIRGQVQHGAKLGRTLGFPTANLNLGDYCRPAYGVYAVRVVLPGGARVDGVANLGIRPMIEPPLELLEVWLMDWSGDLYGAAIDVELVAYLRPELKLPGLEALKAQIALDAAAARATLA
jgi:riboflavin kinase/FMN adenylyltransferase